MKQGWWLLLLLFARAACGWSLAGSNIGGWPTRSLPVYFNASSCGMTDDELGGMIDHAIDAWNAIPNLGVRLYRVGTPVTTTAQQFLVSAATLTPLIVCDATFSADNEVDANRVPATTRLALSADGRLGYAGVLLNAEIGSAAYFPAMGNDEQQITLAHELGHVLGLGHSSSTKSLMYYSIGNKSSVVLTQDDSDGAAFLYPRSEFAANPFGCGAVHDGRSPWTLWWAVIFLAGTWGIGRLLVVRSRPR